MSAPASPRASAERVRPISILAQTLVRASLLLLVVLAGCAAPRIKPDANLLAGQDAREHTLATQRTWQLDGRLGVSDGHDGGSGSLQWHQDGDTFDFSVHAPVTGKTWVLSGDAHRAELKGLREQAVEGDSASALLERELGWHVPVAELTSWVRGARANGDARIEFNSDGLPAVIEQDGWKIEYPDYDTAQRPPLPRRIFASRGEYRVRLSVSQWR